MDPQAVVTNEYLCSKCKRSRAAEEFQIREAEQDLQASWQKTLSGGSNHASSQLEEPSRHSETPNPR